VAVIDLGEVTDRPPDPVAGPITAGLDRRRLRPVALLAALLAVLACGAAARPAEPGLRLLWTAPHSTENSLVLAEDAIYVLSGGARAEVVAYALADGRRLWRWGTDAHLISVYPAPGGGPVLAVVDPASSGNRDGPAAQASRTTVALRAGSGAEMWRQPGEPHWQAITADSALLSEYDPRGGVAALRRIGLEDGAARWSSSTGPVQHVVVELAGDRPRRLVTATSAGDVTVLDWADGRRLAARRITPGPGRGGIANLTASNDRLFTTTFNERVEAGTVYRLDDLSTFQVAGHRGLSECGGVLCAWDQDGFAMIDPENGRELWRGPEIIASVMTNDRILTDQKNGVEHVLLDSRTGDELSGPVPGWVAWAWPWPDHVLLLRPTTEPIGRTAVTRLDLRTGRAVLIGSLAPMPDQQSCQTTPGHLVCIGWDRVVVAAVPG
jgi:hypothetical protein